MTTRVEIVPEQTGSEKPAAPPAGLLPQFKTIEAQNASYLELQAELTRVKQAKGLDGAPSPDDKPADQANPNDLTVPDAAAEAAKKEAEDKAAADAAKDAGVDLDPYQAEFNSTGDVAEENRAAIAKSLEKLLGPNARTVVDQYIDGRKTSVTNDVQAIKGAVGGDEAYGTMVSWAKGALTPQEIATFNTQVNSGDRTAAIFAVEALRGRFEKANGREPKLYKGTFTPSASALPKFKSSAEMTAAMQDPRYKTDAAYRDEVKSRIT